jgi:hypothetical protein
LHGIGRVHILVDLIQQQFFGWGSHCVLLHDTNEVIAWQLQF